MKRIILVSKNKILSILTIITYKIKTTPMIFVEEKKEKKIDTIFTQQIIIRGAEIDNLYFLKTNSFSSRKWSTKKRGTKKLFKVSRKNYSRRNDRRSREYRTKACSD
jgi:hypothetical protein